MSRVTIAVPSIVDINRVAAHLRQADLEELGVVHPGMVPGVAVLQALRGAEKVYCFRVDGRAAGLFGTSKAPEGTGVWMFGTPDIERFGKSICRAAKAVLADMLEQHGHLYNYVLEANTVHIRWIQYLGATFADEPLTFNGHQFRRFDFHWEGGPHV